MLRLRLGSLLLACCLGLLTHAPAWADARRVALVGLPGNVERAAITALEPWHIEVLALPATPGLGDAAWDERARGLARALAAAHQAGAVVWMLPADPDPLLKLYDVTRDQLITRPLAYTPPLSEPGAAAVALTIKTLLWQSQLAPQAAETSPESVAEPVPAPAPAAAPAPTAALGLESALLLRAGSSHTRGPRLGLAALWAPAWLDPAYTVAARLVAGAALSLQRDDLVGDFTDLSLGLELRRRLFRARAVELHGLAGVSLHRTRLRGLVHGQMPAEATRNNPGLSAGVIARIPLVSRVHGELRAGGAYFPRRQTYVLHDEPVLLTPRVDVEVGLGISMMLR